MTPIDAVKNLVRKVGVPVHTAVQVNSLTPAAVLGLDGTKGSLETGKDADVIVFDDNFEVRAVFIGGRLKWQSRRRPGGQTQISQAL